MFSQSDLSLLKSKGISVEQVEAQLRRHVQGFPYLKLRAAATPGAGIKVLGADEEAAAIDRWQRFLAEGGDVAKFVPASGAASRMFKALYAFADGDLMEAPEGSDVAMLLADASRLPFKDELDEACRGMYGRDLAAMLGDRRHRDIVKAIIGPEGMNYGALPKGLLKFHCYADGSRTPLEEHLTEGAQTAANSSGVVNLHFTVSANHRNLFRDKLDEAVPKAEARTGCCFNVTMSEQKPSTDTIAANPDGTPFRQPDGSLLFRPGGHGALIENLNELDATVVFIKNIDNVVPDALRGDTVKYKTVIAGYLMQLHDAIAAYAAMIEEGDYDDARLADIVDFMKREFCFDDPRLDLLNGDGLAALLLEKLNRPLRVCGMVRNEGEPGGGPFIACGTDGSWQLQILESTQIDMADADAAAMLGNATHFNPVDLVCYLRDIHGDRFNLLQFTDPDTGFISSKSSQGKELKALELPGLWNGAMSDWNTAFVEVPVTTFNPVKTVNDLLRPAHQAE